MKINKISGINNKYFLTKKLKDQRKKMECDTIIILKI